MINNKQLVRSTWSRIGKKWRSILWRLAFLMAGFFPPLCEFLFIVQTRSLSEFGVSFFSWPFSMGVQTREGGLDTVKHCRHFQLWEVMTRRPFIGILLLINILWTVLQENANCSLCLVSRWSQQRVYTFSSGSFPSPLFVSVALRRPSQRKCVTV